MPSLWRDIKVGQIVRVEKDEEIPADLLLLSAPKDVVYISTMNLDGETNLKERTLGFDEILQNEAVVLRDFKGEIACDQPNPSLDYWDGNISSEALNKGVVNCNIKNTLLRGCTLKNTEYCYGVVLYVGVESKIMKNSKKAPRKISKLMLLMN